MKISQKTEEKYLEKVRANGLYLKRLKKSQTPAICLEAVKQNGLALKYVVDQTPEICLMAIKENPWALEYVKEQTSEMCLEAVKRDGEILTHVRKQTPEICLEAMKQYGMALEYVNEQTHRICLEAIKENGWSLEYIEEQTEELTLASFPNLSRMYQEWDLWNYSSFFKLLKNPTQEITSLYNLLEYWEERWPSYREIRSRIARKEIDLNQSPYHVLECLYR